MAVAVRDAVQGAIRSRAKVYFLASLSIPVDFGWAVGEALVVPELLRMGVSISTCALLWVVPPILGVLLQPSVSYASDTMGHRKQFIFALAVMAAAGLLTIVSSASVFLIFAGFGVVDLSHDLLSTLTRAYVNEVASADMREDVNAAYSFMSGVGRLAALVIASLPVERVLGGTSRMRAVFLLSAVLTVLICGLVVWLGPEDPQTRARNARRRKRRHRHHHKRGRRTSRARLPALPPPCAENGLVVDDEWRDGAAVAPLAARGAAPASPSAAAAADAHSRSGSLSAGGGGGAVDDDEGATEEDSLLRESGAGGDGSGDDDGSVDGDGGEGEGESDEEGEGEGEGEDVETGDDTERGAGSASASDGDDGTSSEGSRGGGIFSLAAQHVELQPLGASRAAAAASPERDLEAAGGGGRRAARVDVGCLARAYSPSAQLARLASALRTLVEMAGSGELRRRLLGVYGELHDVPSGAWALVVMQFTAWTLLMLHSFYWTAWVGNCVGAALPALAGAAAGDGADDTAPVFLLEGEGGGDGELSEAAQWGTTTLAVSALLGIVLAAVLHRVNAVAGTKRVYWVSLVALSLASIAARLPAGRTWAGSLLLAAVGGMADSVYFDNPYVLLEDMLPPHMHAQYVSLLTNSMTVAQLLVSIMGWLTTTSVCSVTDLFAAGGLLTLVIQLVTIAIDAKHDLIHSR